MGAVADAVKERTSAAEAAPLQSKADVEAAPEGASDFRRTFGIAKAMP
jgi:hypothetical protein